LSDWYRLESDEVLTRLETDPGQGLAGAEVERRLAEHGLNELVERGTKSPWHILWEQMTALLVVILIIAAIVSLALGDFKDAVAILAIVALNAILGFTQEYRAEQAMAALKKMAVPIVRVHREGHLAEVSARELVRKSQPESWCPATSCNWRRVPLCRPTVESWKASVCAPRRRR
jgi:Ca2+-transporting ATPase